MNQARSVTGPSVQVGQYSSTGTLAGGTSAHIAGRKVVSHQPAATNVLLDAASELTQAFAARVQQRGVKERTVLTGGALAGLTREVRQKTLDHTRLGRPHALREEEGETDSTEPTAQATEKLARAILKQPDRIRRHADEAEGDPTAQFLMLMDAADAIESGQIGPDSTGSAASAIREVLEEMFAERGDRILADVNTVETYSRLSSEQARQFRSVYHDAAIGSESLGGVVGHLLRLVGDGKTGASFLDVHRSMIAALGLDLAAARPSTDKTKLQALVSDLYHLEVIGTLVEAGGALADQLQTRHGLAPFAATQLTTDLVGLAGERWVDADHFKRLADRYRAMDPLEATVDFLTGVRNLVKEMPVKVFPTPENRQSLIDAAQDAVDYAIDREEGIVS